MHAAGRSDFLNDFGRSPISRQQLKEVQYLVINFGIRSELLDQTIIQAITLTQSYLALNPRVSCSFLIEVAIIAIVIAIKNNEDVVLKLDECLNVRDSFRTHHLAMKGQCEDGDVESSCDVGTFDAHMFAELER